MSSQRFALIVGVFIPLVISGGISSLFQSNVGRINLFHHTFSPSELGEDFDVLRQGLEEGHPGLYRYTSKAEMDRAFDTTKLQLNRPMNEVELYRVLAPLVAHIKCGHTVLHPAPSDEVRGGELVFPFSVRVQSGRIFLYDDFATAHQTLAGAEVVSINDAPASRILSTMMADIGSDGSILTFKENWIGQGRGGGIFRALFSRMLTPTLGIRSPYVLKYRSVQTGEEKSLNIAGEPFDALVKVYETKYPMEARPPRLPDGRIAPKGMPEFFDGGSIAVWRFPGFGGYTDEDRRGSFVERAFQLIRDHGSAALILDTRNVGGGADFIGAKLFSYFADAPFRYYDDLIANRLSFKFFSHVYKPTPLPAEEFEKRADGAYHWVKHPNWGILQPSQPHFAGKTYILTNGGCFSTCSEFISMMHYHKKATFIGAEGGGNYYGNTSGFEYQLILPHSKLYLQLPVVGYYLSVAGYSHRDRGVLPDYPIDSQIDSIPGGTDDAMNGALSLARGGLQ